MDWCGNVSYAPDMRSRFEHPAPALTGTTPGHVLQVIDAAIAKRGETALSARGVPADVLPGDVYDLASLVLGELAFLHALTPQAAPVHAFEPAPTGPRLPAHVDQLARTLEAQLAGIS